MAGLDETGFTKKTLPEVIASLEARAQIKFGPTIDTSEDSVLGLLIGMFAEEIALSWDGAQGTYDGYNPSTNEGVPQDNTAEMVGIQRLGAAKSTTTGVAKGDLAVIITANSRVSVNETLEQFSVIANKTLTLTDPVSIDINVDTVLNSTTYTVTINGTAISFTSDGTATLSEITAGLTQAINFSTEQQDVVSVDNGAGSFTVTGLVTPAAAAITNLLTESQTIGTAPWADVGTPTITVDDEQAPDGTTTADKVDDDDGGAFEGRNQSITITSSTDSYVLSGYIRIDTLSTARLRLQFTGGTGLDGNIEIDMGTVSVVENGDTVASSGIIEALANGWFRVQLRVDDNGTGNTAAVVEIDAGNAIADTGSIHVWGFQLERGVTVASEYIPTVTTQITRDATTAAATQVPPNFIIALGANLSTLKVSTDIPVIANNFGPVAAPVNQLVNIDTPIFGWDSFDNPDSADLGREVETDTSFRQRRFESVQIAGAGTVPAIESNVRQINGVTDAFVIENRDIVPDGDGRPGKSFETIVQGGLEQEVAQEIWDVKPVGIETFGSISKTISDSQGNSQTINFSRPTNIWVHLEIDYTLNPEEIFPDGGEEVMKTTAVTTGSALGIGIDVILQKFFGDIYTAVSGIGSLVIRQAVSATEFGPPGAFTTTNLVIDPTELSNFDEARITVTQV